MNVDERSLIGAERNDWALDGEGERARFLEDIVLVCIDEEQSVAAQVCN